MRILLLEPYFGGSHRQWAQGYVAHSRHDISLVVHDGAFWRWRMRGGALTLAEAAIASIEADGQPDIVLVSDMVDLPAFLGFARSALSDVPVVLYMHENQLVYPLGPRQQPDEALSIINWLSMAAADRLVFNSEFHRRATMDALPALLARAPDHRHTHRLDEVLAKSSVLPVGVETDELVLAERPRRHGATPLILWNHRWDHDKDPRSLFAVLRQLVSEGVDFELALAGENERVDPREFLEIRRDLSDRVVQFGRLPRDAYVDLLLRSDIAVSTARHEFFGVASVEAIAAGAIPLLPRRLSYPELIPEWAHDFVLYGEGELLDRLRDAATDSDAARPRLAALRKAMSRFSWSKVAPAYDSFLESVPR